MTPTSLILTFMVSIFSAAPALAGPPADVKCEALKSKIAGKYFACRKTAESKAKLKSLTADFSKCDAKFGDKWNKTELKGGGACPDAVSAGVMRHLLSSSSEKITDIIGGVGHPAVCGDGIVNATGETCDGSDFRGQTCAGLGLGAGALACTAHCTLNTSGCGGSSCSPPAEGFVPQTAGCECRETWTSNGQLFCGRSCGNPDNDSNGPWCFTEAQCAGQNFTYCEVEKNTCSPSQYEDYEAPSGCECKEAWTFNGATFCGGTCANPDNDSNGPWCFTKAECNGASFGYCSQQASGCSAIPPAYENLVPNTPACTCRDEWTYEGVKTCGGKCNNPDNDANGAWCFTTATCNGVNYAYCEAPQP